MASVSKKFNVKVFYVMGKALSGELSCPCDRSYVNYLHTYSIMKSSYMAYLPWLLIFFFLFVTKLLYFDDLAFLLYIVCYVK